MVVKAVISYDGSKFFGFQKQQKNGKKTNESVTSKIEDALFSIGIESKIIGSGRTDKGVHAFGQVISFVLPDFWSDLDLLKYQINRLIQPYIYLRSLKITDDSFNPRYDAKKRVYRYIFSTKVQSPFLADYVTFVKDLNIDNLKNALKIFEGTHDFVNFRKTGSDEPTTIRTIYKTLFYEYKNFYIICFEGDAFLRSQIRMIMFALFSIAKGKISLEELKKQLENKKNCCRGVASASGLYLSKIVY